jgi:uncharacterized protein
MRRSTGRHEILDMLRGIALLGICLANFGEFSLYTFQAAGVTEAMPTAAVDRAVRFFQYLLIDGKFYTLFSLLFGIGFSIILSNAQRNGLAGVRIFYRRMAILLLIGVGHLIFLWAGDILVLYAAIGMLLPLLRGVSDRKLLVFSALLLVFPIAMDALVAAFDWNLSAPVDRAMRLLHDRAGITNENFPVWLAEAGSYGDVLKFNVAGAFIRMREFIEGNRVPRVLGIFLLGLWVGRKAIYADLEGGRRLLKRTALWGAAIGVPTSILYAWEATHGHPLGAVAHSAIYAVSVVPLSLAYTCGICLWYINNRERRIVGALAAPGRMALTNYIMQSVFGGAIFYGIGLGFGARVGLVWVEVVAVAVFAVQMLGSILWLSRFNYGPLEWIWRMLTYGKRLNIVKPNSFDK